MIQSLADRLNDLSKSLSSAALLNQVRDRGAEIRKPDFSAERALRDLASASEALGGVKVYAVARPLGPAGHKAWETNPAYRERLWEDLAMEIGRGLHREGCVETRLVETDEPGVMAVVAEAAIVTPPSSVRHFANEANDAFKAGAEALRRVIKRGADAIRNCTAEEGFARVCALIDSAKASQVEAPDHLRQLGVATAAPLAKAVIGSTEIIYRHGRAAIALELKRGDMTESWRASARLTYAASDPFTPDMETFAQTLRECCAEATAMSIECDGRVFRGVLVVEVCSEIA